MALAVCEIFWRPCRSSIHQVTNFTWTIVDCVKHIQTSESNQVGIRIISRLAFLLSIFVSVPIALHDSCLSIPASPLSPQLCSYFVFSHLPLSFSIGETSHPSRRRAESYLALEIFCASCAASCNRIQRHIFFDYRLWFTFSKIDDLL